MHSSRPWSGGASRRGGFTLVELAVVCLLAIATSVVLGQLFVGLLAVNASSEAGTDLVQMGRAAAETMTAELRLAKSFHLASSSAVEFVADLGSGDTAIRYYLMDPGNDGLPPIYLYRAAGVTTPPAGQGMAVLLDLAAGAAPVLPSTPRLDFRYHDATGAEMAPPLDAAHLAQVRLVGVTMTLENVDDAPSPPVPHRSVVLRWAVAIRNMD